MGDPDGNVVSLPISPEEGRRRIMVEAARQAYLSPGEWRLWYKDKAAQFGIEPEQFAELIIAQIKDREAKAAEKLKQDRLEEQRAERQRKTDVQEFREKARAEDAAAKRTKTTSKAFADIIKLPADQHDAKLEALAKELKEDVDTLKAEFADYRGAEIEAETKSSSDWDVEPWPEPVSATVVLEELITCINTHIVAKPHEVLVIALWFMMTWVHDAAHWSVYLVATAPDIYCGKTTLVIDISSRLLPKPAPMGGKLTESTFFHLIDREHPTVLIDNADELFKRNKDVTDLFLVGYTRGVKVRRNAKIGGEWVPVEYDVFCPKMVSLLGKIPPALLSRCLVIKLQRAMPGEEPVEVDPFNEELMERFKTLKRKLARWRNDHVKQLKTAAPVFPTGLTTRPKNDAKLLLSIAELAGPEWADMARTALERLLRDEREPSWLERLLQELWVVFFEEKRKPATEGTAAAAAITI